MTAESGSINEAEVIERVLEGDREAYGLLVTKYQSQIYNLAFQMTGSAQEADDLAQEAFLKAYLSLGIFRKDGRFFAWLYTIALNLARNHQKRKKRFQFESTDSPESETWATEGVSPEEALVRIEKATEITRGLETLSPGEREAVVLRFFHDLNYEDVAGIIGVTPSGAKMRVYRGLEKLKKILKK